MASFRCQDIGMACNYEDKALTRGGLLKKIAAHAKAVHSLDPIPADVMAKVSSAIR